MRIEGSECIRDIFSIFHDGTVTHVTRDGSNLIWDIEIKYLAERISPSYEKFFVRLATIQGVHFSTWPSDLKSEPIVLTDVEVIFKPELEILESNIKEGNIQVVCNQLSPDFEYCGGELYFQAEFAEVTDEAGKQYSIDELDSLCKSYWDDWANRSCGA